MRKESQEKRKGDIEDAAYELLDEKGYSSTSMLNIAKHAKASNETLYRWYGDKHGLFLSMVHSNSASIKKTLENALIEAEEPTATLDRVAPILLAMLLGERAVSLNRAAAADPSNELGLAISQGGKELIAPLFAQVIERLLKDLEILTLPTKEALEMYFSLLIGDRQIRRAIGVTAQPTTREVENICQTAKANFLRLLSTYQ